MSDNLMCMAPPNTKPLQVEMSPDSLFSPETVQLAAEISRTCHLYGLTPALMLIAAQAMAVTTLDLSLSEHAA